MEEQAAMLAAQRPEPVRLAMWGDIGLLVLLLLVAGGVRCWLVRHTEVMARDGIGFISYDWQLEHHAWPQVLRANAQHPLYPITVILASVPVRHVLAGRPLADTMMISAQLACTVSYM